MPLFCWTNKDTEKNQENSSSLPNLWQILSICMCLSILNIDKKNTYIFLLFKIPNFIIFVTLFVTFFVIVIVERIKQNHRNYSSKQLNTKYNILKKINWKTTYYNYIYSLLNKCLLHQIFSKNYSFINIKASPGRTNNSYLKLLWQHDYNTH